MSDSAIVPVTASQIDASTDAMLDELARLSVEREMFPARVTAIGSNTITVRAISEDPSTAVTFPVAYVGPPPAIGERVIVIEVERGASYVAMTLGDFATAVLAVAQRQLNIQGRTATGNASGLRATNPLYLQFTSLSGLLASDGPIVNVSLEWGTGNTQVPRGDSVLQLAGGTLTGDLIMANRWIYIQDSAGKNRIRITATGQITVFDTDGTTQVANIYGNGNAQFQQLLADGYIAFGPSGSRTATNPLGSDDWTFKTQPIIGPSGRAAGRGDFSDVINYRSAGTAITVNSTTVSSIISGTVAVTPLVPVVITIEFVYSIVPGSSGLLELGGMIGGTDGARASYQGATTQPGIGIYQRTLTPAAGVTSQTWAVRARASAGSHAVYNGYCRITAIPQ